MVTELQSSKKMAQMSAYGKANIFLFKLGLYSQECTNELLRLHWWSGESNWHPTPVSCLENPREGGTWWAAVYGVAQSQTRLKRLCSTGDPGVKKTHYHGRRQGFDS